MASLRLSPEPTSTALARRFLDRVLTGVAVDLHVAALLLTELVANASVHAGTEFDVVVEVGGVLRVEVRDGVAVTDVFRRLVAEAPRQVDPSESEGRGLMLVSTLAVRFGLDDLGPAGKAVWFEMPIAGATRGSGAGPPG